MEISSTCPPGKTSCSPMEKMVKQPAEMQPQKQATQLQAQDMSPQFITQSGMGKFLDISV